MTAQEEEPQSEVADTGLISEVLQPNSTKSGVSSTAAGVLRDAKLPSMFRDPEPRQHHDSLEALLADIEHYLGRFITFSNEHQAPTIAVWIVHTWLIDQCDDTGYLHIYSAEKQSGKSRAAEVIGPLCRRFLPMLDPTGPTLYRTMDTFRPTLFIDEVDALFGKKSEEYESVRSVLNGGYHRGTPVIRLTGQKHEPQLFDAFGAKILAGIGSTKLPDTILDRSIPIEMKRRRPSDRTERYQQRRVADDQARLRESIAFFANSLDITASDPALPDELSDRAADIWTPLLAIADHAGERAALRARAAAVALNGQRDHGTSLGVQLLADIRTFFIQNPVDRVFSKKLHHWLCNDLEESPYADLPWWTQNKMSRQIAAYGIKGNNLRIGSHVMKGFLREQFIDAWERYTPYLTEPLPPVASQPHLTLVSDESQEEDDYSWVDELDEQTAHAG